MKNINYLLLFLLVSLTSCYNPHFKNTTTKTIDEIKICEINNTKSTGLCVYRIYVSSNECLFDKNQGTHIFIDSIGKYNINSIINKTPINNKVLDKYHTYLIVVNIKNANSKTKCWYKLGTINSKGEITYGFYSFWFRDDIDKYKINDKLN